MRSCLFPDDVAAKRYRPGVTLLRLRYATFHVVDISTVYTQ